MSTLAARVQQQLRAHLRTLWPDQVDAGPDRGAILNPAWGVPHPYRAAWAAALVALLEDPGPEEIARAVRAVEHLRDRLREQPLLDLPECNYDSAPDTAFAMQLLVATLRAAGGREPLEALAAPCRDCLALALPAVAAGGFHTPNHRWVIASALAQSARVLGVDVPDTVRDLLSEGLDIDDEGAWIEHSAGVYDAVCDRSVLLLADAGVLPEAEAVAAVTRNLELNAQLLQPDGTIETGLSSRQDRGQAVVPHELAPVMLARPLADDPRWGPLAAWLWDRGEPSLPATIWMADALRGRSADDPLQAPADGTWLLPRSRVWRHRSGRLAVTAGAGRHDVLALRLGEVAVQAVRVHHLYFGPEAGSFWPETIEETADGVALLGSGTRDPRRPGYEQPLARPVALQEWESVLPERAVRRLPPIRTRMDVSVLADGVALRIRTLDGHPGVLAVLAIDVPEGGTWTTQDTAVRPVAGQTVLLRRGFGELRVGSDILRVGPGADHHRVWEPRDLPAAAGAVRLLVPLVTPLDHTLVLSGR